MSFARFRDVEIRFGALTAVAGVSLDIPRGRTVGLVGESGSGKTTLGKAALALNEITAGSIEVDGIDVRARMATDRLAFRRLVQLMFQDPVSSLSPRLTLRQLLAEPIQVHSLPFDATWDRMMALIRRIGINETHLDRYPNQVSGGQARRVAIARALILNPAFIVCDEPTAGLDVSVQGDLLNLMRDLQDEHGLTYLIISHNLNVIRRVTDRVAVMYLGRIVEEGPTADLFARPAHPYTAALIAANPAVDPARRRARVVLSGEIPSPLNPPQGCRFHTRCPIAREICRTDPPVTVRGEGTVACHFPVAGVA